MHVMAHATHYDTKVGSEYGTGWEESVGRRVGSVSVGAGPWLELDSCQLEVSTGGKAGTARLGILV